jgi:large subunit ribosomal protein L21
MYAIVEIAGQQFKVAKDQKVFVHRLKDEEGQKVAFDQVLLLGDGDQITVGAPAIDGAAVEAKVVKHLKGDKVIVFKKKRRKGYRKKNGHRQYLTELVIEKIVAKGAKKKAAKPAAKAEKPAAKPAAKKAAPAPKKETTAKKAATPKAKPAPKKVKADDLKKIEGIGPKAAEALAAAGLESFAKLAKAKPEAIKEILTEASSRMAHLDPGTWPQQAKLAAADKWDELKELQDKLNGGK